MTVHMFLAEKKEKKKKRKSTFITTCVHSDLPKGGRKRKKREKGKKPRKRFLDSPPLSSKRKK